MPKKGSVVLRIINRFFYFGSAIMLMTSLMLGLVFQPVQASSGAIWTTSGSCGSPQNVNHYYTGEAIYINYSDFSAQTGATWQIQEPGSNGAIVVGSSNQVTNSYGTFGGYTVNIDASGAGCFLAFIFDTPGGPYQTKFGGVTKNDNFSVDAAATNTPAPTGTSVPTGTPVPTNTTVPTNTPTNTAVPTNTPIPTETSVPTNTPTDTAIPTGTSIPTNTPTNTPIPTETSVPTNTPTDTLVPTGTALPTNTPTNTPVATTETPVPTTQTPVPPTETPIPTTVTPIPTTVTPIPTQPTPEQTSTKPPVSVPDPLQIAVDPFCTTDGQIQWTVINPNSKSVSFTSYAIDGGAPLAGFTVAPGEVNLTKTALGTHTVIIYYGESQTVSYSYTMNACPLPEPSTVSGLLIPVTGADHSNTLSMGFLFGGLSFAGIGLILTALRRYLGL